MGVNRARGIILIAGDDAERAALAKILSDYSVSLTDRVNGRLLKGISLVIVGENVQWREALRNGDGKSVPVLAVVSDTGKALADGWPAGIADFLEKPLLPAVVRRRVSNVMELYRRRCQSRRMEPAPEALEAQAAMEAKRRADWRVGRKGAGGNEQYRLLSELAEEIVFTVDFRAGDICFSEKYREVFGRDIHQDSAREALLQDERMEAADKQALLAGVDALTEQAPSFRLETALRMPNGELHWYEIYLHALWNSAGVRTGMLGKLADIHARKTETMQWRLQAQTDFLTGTCNRAALEGAIRERIAADVRGESCFFVLFTDIDNLKRINDCYGHAAGDEAIRRVASALSAQLRRTDVVGRVGGDEFVALLDCTVSEKLLRGKVEQLQQELAQRSQIPVSVSMGVAVYPRDGQTCESVLRRADMALYAAKRMGKGCLRVYEPGIDSEGFHSMITKPD